MAVILTLPVTGFRREVEADEGDKREGHKDKQFDVGCFEGKEDECQDIDGTLDAEEYVAGSHSGNVF